ncbi:PaaI family thioesterase [Brevibacillus choshinensis]|uniref:PaaI family thioesterase n=1 Tax=Brevibacillus choshinensis TaxID=54911 RepID=UPI002E2266AC|nr:PaaI family thioesterase [Brevibacillus choshinensis]MED4750879.1 PaaI family thioesterase [Brevibacillus choshinensis]MED4783007.1 PaaI family thioesterase [Brevibacillus choshinensis]
MKATKPILTPHDPEYAERVRESFERQGAMKLIGATLAKVAPGEVEIYLPYREDLTQQHGFVHAGIVTTIVDNACGFAAYSLMPADASVLSVEFKVNLLAPAKGDGFIARGEVIKPGRTITVCNGEVYAPGEDNKLIATMTATVIMLQGRSGIPQG